MEKHDIVAYLALGVAVLIAIVAIRLAFGRNNGGTTVIINSGSGSQEVPTEIRADLRTGQETK